MSKESLRYFPLYLDSRDKQVLIVGGGPVAAAKLKSLLRGEFTFFVVAEEFSIPMQEVIAGNLRRIDYLQTKIDLDLDFANADLLVLATNDKGLQEALAKKAEHSGIWYLRTDEAEESAIHLSKIIEQNGLILTLRSRWPNPSLSQILAEDLSDFLADYDEEQIKLLAELRRVLIAKDLRGAALTEEIKKYSRAEIRELQERLNELK